MMEAVCTPETIGYFNETTQRCIPEGYHLQKATDLISTKHVYNKKTQTGDLISLLFTFGSGLINIFIPQ
jgi:hypothetical protein